jgi:hypothetical protein
LTQWSHSKFSNRLHPCQLYDIPDLSDLIINLKKELNDKNIKLKDYEYLDEIKSHFEYLHKIYKSDWEKYSLITKRYYDKEYNISEEKIEILNKRFKIGSKVVYYISDKEVELRKWRQRWTGPWKIIDRPDTRTAITGLARLSGVSVKWRLT